MPLSDVIDMLRRLSDPTPSVGNLPTEGEVAAAEQRLGIRFPRDYRYFLLHGSDIDYGIMEPAQVTRPGHTNLDRVASKAWEAGIPKDFLPFCEYNGDYYCFAPDGRIGLLSHDGLSEGNWPDLAHWIQEVWIDEFQEMQDECRQGSHVLRRTPLDDGSNAAINACFFPGWSMSGKHSASRRLTRERRS